MKILVIRRDNIGDLVCTTPLLRELRRQLPDVVLEVLATRYNEAVLAGNPDINALHYYIKAKHRKNDSLVRIYIARFVLLLRLYSKKYDLALLPGDASKSAMRLARWIRPKRVVSQSATIDFAHEVERCCSLLPMIGLSYASPPPLVCSTGTYSASLKKTGRVIVGVHISARKPSQQWDQRHFLSLMRKIHDSDPETAFLLLWSPGSRSNPLHPGDDEKAEAIVSEAGEIPLTPVSTTNLSQLISAIAQCDRFICADGGAMHIAAGLGKPIVALFGKSDARRWHPWGVPYRLLQAEDMDVASIGVNHVCAEYMNLIETLTGR